MKLCIQTFTTLLIIVVILLTGCNGDQQKPPEQVEPQADTQKDVTTFPEADADTTLPTTFYPPENPYEDLTEQEQHHPMTIKTTLFFGYPILNINWRLAICQRNIMNGCQ